MNCIEVVAERNERLIKIRSNPILLQAAKIHYKSHPVDFINDWMFTYDPRQSQPLLPFILFKRQEEYIHWLIDRWQGKESGLVEKSRDMGLTWLSMAFSIWIWLFHDGIAISFGSRKEELVDRIGDPKSIFEKGRTILNFLPKEFLPTGFNLIRNCTHMKILNPENGSSITGEAGDNMGRGGRSSIYFKDESAFYERPERIEASISQNSDVKIDISTPNGEGNPFWRKRFGGKIAVFTFHWRDDPRKDDVWYQKQCDELDPITVAQEIDIDYSASIDNVTIPSAWVRAAINLDIKGTGLRFAGFDVADEGTDYKALAIRKGSVVESIERWKEGNTTQAARKVFNRCQECAIDNLNYDVIGVGAGVKGELWSLSQQYTHRININGVVIGEGISKEQFTPEKKNEDLFLNLKAELWWKLRRRFERTYEHVKGIKEWPIDELISIPNDSELISQLSRQLYEKTENGKIKMESKAKMKKRGVASPDMADALVLSYAPTCNETLKWAQVSLMRR